MTGPTLDTSPEPPAPLPEFDAARLRRLVDMAPDVLLVVDGRARIKWASPASLAVLGVDYPALVGRPVLDLCTFAQDRDRLARHFGRSEDPQGVQGPLAVTVIHPDGSRHELEAMVNNQLHVPELAGVVVTIRDVTSRDVTSRDVTSRVGGPRPVDAGGVRIDVALGGGGDPVDEPASLLEAMARGLPLEDTFRRIVEMIEARIPGASPAVGILESDGWVRYPVLPTRAGAVVEAFNSMGPDSDLGTALRAIGTEPSIVTSLAGRRRWAGVADLVEELDLRACWTWPAFSSQDHHQLVGALVVLHRDARGPTEVERALLERSMDLAAIAIDRHHLRTALDYRAQHDALTGLPNRVSLLDQIRLALERVRRSDLSVAVLFVDLDRFKLINDSLGHAVGDRLLEAVATRFRSALRPHDVVGRFGGDEFVVVCDAVADPQVALTVADRLRQSLAAPFVIDDRQLVVTASIGIAQTSDPDTDPHALIRDADVALYRAKSGGRDTSAMFRSGDQERVVRTLDIEHHLRSAIDDDGLAVHGQPVVRSLDGTVVGVEALVRWQHPVLGDVSPVEMIPVAEESGLILGLGRLVLGRACDLAAGWPPTPQGTWPWVSVNVSARQFADRRFIGDVADALDRSGLAPERLCLELTETAFVGDDAVAVGALVGLKALGVRIAIDDFGTGHASLDYIRRFSVADALKIDRSFVAGLGDPAGHDRAIIAAVVALGTSLGFSVIAEGVETEAQRHQLQDLGCELAQGYLFARPGPAEEVATAVAVGVLPLDPS